MSSPTCRIEPLTTLPVICVEPPPPPAAITCEGERAGVSAAKLVYIKAPARSTAAPSATPRRILRLRDGSMPAGRDYRRDAVPALLLLRAPTRSCSGARARVPLAGPRAEHEREPRILGRADGPALV